MKKTILIFCLFVLPFYAQGQFSWATAIDSFTFNFRDSIIFIDTMPQHDAYGGAIPDTSIIVLDTTGCGIWQIGNTNKTVFSPVDTIYRRGIMTDTVGHYPINSNNSFRN
jgi:hypothetical protein